MKRLLPLYIALLCLVSTPALADVRDDRIAAMEQQMRMMMEELQTLKAERASEKQARKQLEEEVAALKTATRDTHEKLQVYTLEPAAGDENDVKITMNPSPRFESADGKYTFQTFGRVHLDATHFIDDNRDHPSNAHFRRARLGVKGQLGEDWQYKTEIDFGGEGVGFKDVTMTYSGLDSADITVGHYKPVLGLENNTSSNYIQFLERAAPSNAFTRGELIGIGGNTGAQNWSLAGGLWSMDAGNTGTGDDEDISVDLRGSANILGMLKEDAPDVLHVGAGVSHRKIHGSTNFDARATGIGDDLVDTGAIGMIDRVTVFGTEAASTMGSFSAQGEYFKTDVSRKSNAADASFDGYYGQVSWLLTGETRPYKGSDGNFSRVKPDTPFNLSAGGWGAWELLARYDNVDLNDAGAGITGGEMDNITLGINWYLNNNARFMANFVDVDTDSNAPVADDDPQIINLRAQWDF